MMYWSWDCEPAFSCIFFHVFVQFSFFPYFEWWNFSTKISVKLCKLEYSYLVCRLIMMYCMVGLRTSLLLLSLPCICPIFFLSILWMMKFSSKISVKLCKLEYSYLVCRLIMMYCIVGLRTSLFLLFFPVFIYYSFFLHFSSKISPQLYRMETSNLVYRFTMTSCIVELKMGLLLLVLPYICSFFFLSRFFVKDIFTTV